MTVVRVLPDVSGLDKEFDYLVPDRFADRVAVGTLVRIPLHGRRVGGWILDVDPEPDPALGTGALKELTGVTGVGPSGDVIGLATWAAWRWAGKRRQFLVTASPRTAVARVPGSIRTGAAPAPTSPATTALLEDLAVHGRAVGVLRIPPSADPMPALASAIAVGPTLVVVPEAAAARLLAARIRRAGLSVALVPDEWAAAAGGVDVVIGARSAAWAPCPGMATAVVVDEHDEALQSESSPTWHARDVLVERCRRLGARLVLVSPVPTLHAVALATPVHPPPARERAGWPAVEVVDRTDELPWKRTLITSALIAALRDPARRVVCVSNTTGRSRLLACRSCRALARCERCDAAVVLDDQHQLVCPSCSTSRPGACTACRSNAFANLRPGVTRLREELEAAAGRPVARITGMDDAEVPDDVGIVIGTEAALHRIPRADVVAFLDLDRELLAPRYRATEQTMALLARAARLVGGRRDGGRLLLQTFLPDHPVVRAVVLGDPGRLEAEEMDRRLALGLPPAAALASVSGAGAEAFVATLDGVEVGGSTGEYLVRAETWEELSNALRAGSRPPGVSVRVAVDPPRV